MLNRKKIISGILAAILSLQTVPMSVFAYTVESEDYDASYKMMLNNGANSSGYSSLESLFNLENGASLPKFSIVEGDSVGVVFTDKNGRKARNLLSWSTPDTTTLSDRERRTTTWLAPLSQFYVTDNQGNTVSIAEAYNKDPEKTYENLNFVYNDITDKLWGGENKDGILQTYFKEYDEIQDTILKEFDNAIEASEGINYDSLELTMKSLNSYLTSLSSNSYVDFDSLQSSKMLDAFFIDGNGEKRFARDVVEYLWVGPDGFDNAEDTSKGFIASYENFNNIYNDLMSGYNKYIETLFGSKIKNGSLSITLDDILKIETIGLSTEFNPDEINSVKAAVTETIEKYKMK